MGSQWDGGTSNKEDAASLVQVSKSILRGIGYMLAGLIIGPIVGLAIGLVGLVIFFPVFWLLKQMGL